MECQTNANLQSTAQKTLLDVANSCGNAGTGTSNRTTTGKSLASAATAAAPPTSTESGGATAGSSKIAGDANGCIILPIQVRSAVLLVKVDSSDSLPFVISP